MSLAETYETFVSYFSESDFGLEDRGDDWYITTQLHTSKIIPVEVLRRDYDTGFNKEVRVFHISPEKDVRSFIGTVDNLWWDDDINQPMVKLKIYGHSILGNKLKRIINEDLDKPMKDRRIQGISAGLIETRNKLTKEIVRFHVREVSLARQPVCDDCAIDEISISNFEKGSQMSVNDERYLQLLEKSMKGFESRLDNTVATYEKLNDELMSKVERYEQTILLQKEEIERLSGEATEFSTKVSQFEKDLSEAKTKADLAEKQPKIKEILQYQKFDPSTDDGKAKIESLQKLNIDALDEMIAGYERIVKLGDKGLSGGFNPGSIDPNQITVGQFEKMSPEDRRKLTDKYIDGASVPREAGDHMGPLNGGGW